MAPRSDALKKAQKAYIEKFSRIEIRVTPEERENIYTHAAARGESVNEFIKKAINRMIRRDDNIGK